MHLHIAIVWPSNLEFGSVIFIANSIVNLPIVICQEVDLVPKSTIGNLNSSNKNIWWYRNIKITRKI